MGGSGTLQRRSCLVTQQLIYIPPGTYRRILISWRAANHVNIIELKHVGKNPTNNNHSTDGFERIMDVIAFYNTVQNKLGA